jgi:predicted AAA+ superfamily ATPase
MSNKLEILKTLILDFLDAPLFTGVARETKIVHVSGKATVCVGVRRSGKSTYMFQVMASLLKEGV